MIPLDQLPPCRHRGAETSPGRYVCSTRRLMKPMGDISGLFCATRCWRVDLPDEAPTRQEDKDRLRKIVAIPQGGPGTELKALLASLGLTAEEGCGCDRMAAWMDALGPDGCLAHRGIIEVWLREKQANVRWYKRLEAAGKAIASGLAFRLDPRDPAPGLLNEAVRRSR